jgi:hypothetical protein
MEGVAQWGSSHSLANSARWGLPGASSGVLGPTGHSEPAPTSTPWRMDERSYLKHILCEAENRGCWGVGDFCHGNLKLNQFRVEQQINRFNWSNVLLKLNYSHDEMDWNAWLELEGQTRTQRQDGFTSNSVILQGPDNMSVGETVGDQQ